MKRAAPLITLITAALTLSACSSTEVTPAGRSGDSPVTLTYSAWALATTPEFQALVDGFEASHENIDIQIKEYDPAQYDTLITADLAAGTAPDIITQKGPKAMPALVEGGQLLDVSDIKFPDEVAGAASYQIDGVQYAVPYRQDAWVLYYNKSLFDAAGVDDPDGSWTWDDYEAAAEKLGTGLKAAGSDAKPAYLHRWQSAVQAIATAQSGADILKGEFDQFKDGYRRALAMQGAGLQVDFNTSTANNLTYQGEFGQQRAAMMPMGTWYVAALLAQVKTGDAQEFPWGFAPLPQADASTTGRDNVPVTFSDPTGAGLNAAIDEAKISAAKEFLAYIAGADAAVALAKIGITPAYIDDDVVTAFFSTAGMPNDDLSQFAFGTRDVSAENPTVSQTAAIQTILGDLHTAVMSGSRSYADAIADAKKRFDTEIR
ncbi:ABC transporter substrate-binding protein [Microbacterium sp. NPDC056052]|uniref:ABC transporter substrate-binding protein n=1 Tax=Microbacterium sp. NPDC056052 TaxID=3345695 RepID=UPI0035E2F96D